jgi:hypothetical protein
MHAVSGGHDLAPAGDTLESLADVPKAMVRRQMNQAGNILLTALEPFSDDDFFAGGPNGISPAWTVGHLACVMDLFTRWIEVRECLIPTWQHEVFNPVEIAKMSTTKAETVNRDVVSKEDIFLLFRTTQVRTLKLLDEFDARLWEAPSTPITPDTLPTYGSVWQNLGVHPFWHLGELCGCIPKFHGTHTLNTLAHYFYYPPTQRSGVFPAKTGSP